MLTLLTYPEGFGQFSLSPFCVKTAYLLTVSGQAWVREDVSDPRKMPHAKLPVLRTPEGLFADSTRIAGWLTDRGAEFNGTLTDVRRAQSHTLVRMAEDHLYFHLVMDRWGNDDVWPIIRETYFKAIPTPLRSMVTYAIRRQVLRGLAFQGVSRFSPEDRMERCEQDLQTVGTHLWQSPFLMGSAPTLADFSVAPMLAAMMATPVETPLSRRVAHDSQLTDYVERLETAIPLP